MIMKFKRILIVSILIVFGLTGCDNKITETIKTMHPEKITELNVYEEYDIPEIDASSINDNTEEDIIKLNNEDFDIGGDIRYDENGEYVTFISGKYSNIIVADIESATESLYSVRSLIGLTDPASELTGYYNDGDGYTETYIFNQLYKGIKVYGYSLVISVRAGSGETCSLNSTLIPTNKIESTSLTPSISINELKKTYAIWSYELEIYTFDEYADSPILVYILETDDECLIVNAYNGEIINSWPTVYNDCWVLQTDE
jgi:hypothetical protein